jgi:hypothetical protein
MKELRDDFADRSADFSFLPIVRTLWSYRRTILLGIAAAVVGFTIVALVLFARMPKETLASVGFRVTFEGAEDDKYPNGTKFSGAEIVSSPVLEEVFTRNELQRYTTFQDFKDSMFILHANPDMEMLTYEYQGKLSDNRLTPVDRSRIEEEFHSKRESLKSPAYSLNLRRSERVVKVPTAILSKVLQDTLSIWAQQAAERKGATNYNIAILSKNSLKMESLAGADFVIAVDMLRSTLERMLKSIAEIAKVPGAEAVRLGGDQMSLADVRAQTEDLIRFYVEPLLGIIRTHGLSRATARPDVYFMDRLLEVQLKREEVRQRMTTLQQALNAYQQTAGAAVPSAGEARTGSVTPQLSESFIDRIVQLSEKADDVKYRQDLTNRIIADGSALADFSRQVDYYESVRKSFGSAQSSRNEAIEAEVTRRTKDLYAEVGRTMDKIEALYRQVSQHNLNPDTVVYQVTAPFVVRTTSSLTARTMAFYFVLTLLAALVLIPLACLAHDYFRHSISPSSRPGAPAGA